MSSHIYNNNTDSDTVKMRRDNLGQLILCPPELESAAARAVEEYGEPGREDQLEYLLRVAVHDLVKAECVARIIDSRYNRAIHSVVLMRTALSRLRAAPNAKGGKNNYVKSNTQIPF